MTSPPSARLALSAGFPVERVRLVVAAVTAVVVALLVALLLIVSWVA